METTKKRSGTNRLNVESAKIRKHLDFAGEAFAEENHSDIAISSIETQPIVSLIQPIVPLIRPSTSAVPIISMASSRDIHLPLGGNKFLTYGFFRGQARISIRLYEVRGTKLYPSKTGISMTPTRFSRFRHMTQDIEENVYDMQAKRNVDMTHHLFNAWRVSINSDYPCVNIRKHFYPPNEMCSVPTKSGITLTVYQWRELVDQIDQLTTMVPDLLNVPRCIEIHGERNLLTLLECPDCSHTQVRHIPLKALRDSY